MTPEGCRTAEGERYFKTVETAIRSEWRRRVAQFLLAVLLLALFVSLLFVCIYFMIDETERNDSAGTTAAVLFVLSFLPLKNLASRLRDARARRDSRRRDLRAEDEIFVHIAKMTDRDFAVAMARARRKEVARGLFSGVITAVTAVSGIPGLSDLAD